MDINDTINRLIDLPRRFNNGSNMSIHDLLKETRYFKIHNKISVESIRNRLAQSLEYVEDWILYSEDKRSGFGWYFKKEDRHRYVVGFLNKEGNKSKNQYR